MGDSERSANADYVRALRPLLPRDAFQPHTRAFIPIAIHLSIVLAGWTVFSLTNRDDGTIAWWPYISLVIGVSMASLSFIAHDVAHRTVTGNRALQYATELVIWSLMFMPPTLWRRVHAIHHAHTNSDNDPDRRFLASELTGAGTVAAATLFPNRHFRFTVTFLLYWVVFPIRNGIALFYSGSNKPGFVTGKPKYSTDDKRWIALELVVVVAFQLALAAFVRSAYVWAAIFPVLIMSAILVWYTGTNHSLNPIGDGDDVLAGSTSVTVPKWCNRLHSNFSYHAEHHIFPAMNPAYYPLVSELLRKHFPARYQRVSIWQAWRAVLRNNLGAVRRGAPASVTTAAPPVVAQAAAEHAVEPVPPQGALAHAATQLRPEPV